MTEPRFERVDSEFHHRLLGPRTVFAVGSTNVDGTEHLCAANNITNISNEPQRVAMALWPEWTTTSNVLRERRFSLSLMPAELVDEVWVIGHRYSEVRIPIGATKFEASGLTRTLPPQGYPSAVSESLALIYCDVASIHTDTGDHVLFIGEVAEAWARKDCFDRRGVLNVELNAVLMQNSGANFARSGATRSASLAQSQHLVDQQIGRE